MSDNAGHIKNPLTLISIFASIAETSGAAILPFIEISNQSVYIWFLMLFPVLVVIIFFITLNFNHRALYAPSDYKDENNFVNPFGKASPEEQGRKLLNEVKEVEAENNNDEFSSTEIGNQKENLNSEIEQKNDFDPDKIRHRKLMGDVTLSEKLAVNKLAKDIGVNFKNDVRFELLNTDVVVVYDALGVSKDDTTVHAVEVKLFTAKKVDANRLERILKDSEMVSKQVKSFHSKDFVLHIVAVMDTSDVDISMLKNSLLSFSNRFKVKVKIHVTTLNDLEYEYQYSP